MLQFQPPGFGQRIIPTSLGVMAYYTATGAPWPTDTTKLASRPPLVFLHSLGGGSSAYEWSKVYPAFAATHRIIAPDLIGWGQSTHPARNYYPDDYLLILAELLQWVGEPAIVIASSLTAGLSIRLAIQRPDLIQQLVLVSPAGYADFGADYGQNLAARLSGIPVLDNLIYQLGAANEFAVQNFLEQFLFADRARLLPEAIAAYLASARQPNGSYAALASLRGDICFDLSLYLSQLQVPTILIWGEQSRFSSYATGKRLAQLNPRQIKLLPPVLESGVLPHLERSAAVIALLKQELAPVRLSQPSR